MPPSNLIPSATEPPTALTAWEIPGLVHGFCGRGGGVSTGAFASFNLAEWVGDDARAVAENWRRWAVRYPNLRVARLIIERCGADELEPLLLGALRGDDVEVVEDFEVIGGESGGADDDRPRPTRRKRSEVLGDEA